MRNVLAFGLCIGWACDGTDTATGDPTTGTENRPEVPFDVNLCDDIPFYDVDNASCTEIERAMDRTMDAARSCNADTDCQVISGDCNANPVSVSCWYAVNLCDSPVPPWPDAAPGRGWASFDRFFTAYDDHGCVYPSGGCGECGPRPEVACVDRTCTCVGDDAVTCRAL